MQEKKKNLENTRFEKDIVLFSIIIILTTAVIFIFLLFAYKFILINFSSENAVILEDKELWSEKRDFSYFLKDKDDDFKEIFTTSISKEEIENIGENMLTIYTPMIQSEAFEIYINNHIIAAEGDFENYNSNIWTNSFYYVIDLSYFDREINEFKVVQYSRYMGGGESLSFIIDGYQSSIKLRTLYMLDINQSILGIALGLILLLSLMIFLFPKRRNSYCLMISVMIFMIIGSMEYLKINNIGLDYLILKKIVITAELFSAVVSTIIIMQFYGKKKYSLSFFLISAILILVPTFFMNDMISYKKLYTVYLIAIVPIIIYWLYESFKNYRKKYASRIIIVISFTFTFFIILCDILGYISPFIPSSLYVSLPLFIIFIIFIIIIDIYELRINVDASTTKYEKVYRSSIIDSLTGTYNIEYTKDMITNTNLPFSIVVLDIDNFKGINDKYGHLAGDKALKNMTEAISDMLRDDDMLGRYGGDEFILLLKLDAEEKIISILERIRIKVEKAVIEFENIKIRMTISIGYYISSNHEEYEKILKKADKALYYAKKTGRNKIANYNNIKQLI